MFGHSLKKMIEKRKKEIMNNPQSVMCEFNNMLEEHGIYFSYNNNLLVRAIREKEYIFPLILKLYYKAILPNEKIYFLRILYNVGYDRDDLCKIIVDVFFSKKNIDNLWSYGELLYQIKNYKFLNEYIEIAQMEELSSSRQMIILLLGESKNKRILPILIGATADESIYGHALEAMKNFTDKEVYRIMSKYVNDKIGWVRKTATEYINNYDSK